MATTRIPTHALRIGLYVARLDVSWFRTPEIPPAAIQRSHMTSPLLPQRKEQLFHTHPRLSALVLERQGGFEPAVLQLIGEHHAYLDGSGHLGRPRVSSPQHARAC